MRTKAFLESRRVSPIARDIKERKLTYLSYRSLRHIEQCLAAVRKEAIPGLFIEAGVALGGSAIVIASLMPAEGEFHGYDVFATIPPPGNKDGMKAHERYRVIASGESQGIGGEMYYGYRDDLYDAVVASFAEYGMAVDGRRVSLHKGPFEETLRPAGKQVAFAHLDCDWYDGVRLCLDRIYPVLSPGGFLISDDYNNYEGARVAVDEFLAAHHDVQKMEPRRPPERTTSLILRKQPR